MVVDTSAVIAFLAGEPEADRIRQTLVRAPISRMSAFNAFECRVALLHNFQDDAQREFELLLLKARIDVVPFDADQSVLAHRAYQRFGKGTGHAAQLNLGDCAAYALAKSSDMALLFKGGDFSRTDIEAVL